MAAVSLQALGRDADAMQRMHCPRGVPVRVFSSVGQQRGTDRNAGIFHGEPLDGVLGESCVSVAGGVDCAEHVRRVMRLFRFFHHPLTPTAATGRCGWPLKPLRRLV